MKMAWNERVDTVMTWFTHGKTPANLVMLYIEEPDVSGHVYSPDSDVVRARQDYYEKSKQIINHHSFIHFSIHLPSMAVEFKNS